MLQYLYSLKNTWCNVNMWYTKYNALFSVKSTCSQNDIHVITFSRDYNFILSDMIPSYWVGYIEFDLCSSICTVLKCIQSKISTIFTSHVLTYLISSSFSSSEIRVPSLLTISYYRHKYCNSNTFIIISWVFCVGTIGMDVANSSVLSWLVYSVASSQILLDSQVVFMYVWGHPTHHQVDLTSGPNQWLPWVIEHLEIQHPQAYETVQLKLSVTLILTLQHCTVLVIITGFYKQNNVDGEEKILIVSKFPSGVDNASEILFGCWKNRARERENKWVSERGEEDGVIKVDKNVLRTQIKMKCFHRMQVINLLLNVHQAFDGLHETSALSRRYVWTRWRA